jgi:DNA polymerase III delta prime subunit
LLAERYRPKSLSDIIGQTDTNKIEMQRWAHAWNIGKPSTKSMMFYGPPGTGKTSAALALAHDNNWDVLETNASDYRNAKELLEEIGYAINFPSFDHKLVLILLDEADSLGKSGLKMLENVLDNSVNPVILTLNDEYAIKRVTEYFRNNSLMYKFASLKYNVLKNKVQEIMDIEHIEQPNLDKLIEYSEGDLRYILNNLEVRDIGPKNATQEIFEILHSIFRGEWDGNTKGLNLENDIWIGVKQNIYDFYNDIYGIPVVDYLNKIDYLFVNFHRLASQGEGLRSFQLYKYINDLIKLLPMHQKTARILYKNQYSRDNPLPALINKIDFARSGAIKSIIKYSRRKTFITHADDIKEKKIIDQFTIMATNPETSQQEEVVIVKTLKVEQDIYDKARSLHMSVAKLTSIFDDSLAILSTVKKPIPKKERSLFDFAS